MKLYFSEVDDMTTVDPVNEYIKDEWPQFDQEKM